MSEEIKSVRALKKGRWMGQKARDLVEVKVGQVVEVGLGEGRILPRVARVVVDAGLAEPCLPPVQEEDPSGDDDPTADTSGDDDDSTVDPRELAARERLRQDGVADPSSEQLRAEMGKSRRQLKKDAEERRRAETKG